MAVPASKRTSNESEVIHYGNARKSVSVHRNQGQAPGSLCGLVQDMGVRAADR